MDQVGPDLVSTLSSAAARGRGRERAWAIDGHRRAVDALHAARRDRVAGGGGGREEDPVRGALLIGARGCARSAPRPPAPRGSTPRARPARRGAAQASRGLGVLAGASRLPEVERKRGHEATASRSCRPGTKRERPRVPPPAPRAGPLRPGRLAPAAVARLGEQRCHRRHHQREEEARALAPMMVTAERWADPAPIPTAVGMRPPDRAWS
jgi:hypothetical protein